MDTQDERAEDERTDQLTTLVEAALLESEPTGPELPPDDADFIVTKEHRRFTEFATAVRRDSLHRPVLRPARCRQDPVRPPLRLLA